MADHNGWAILVSAAAVNGEPTVVDRRRVRLIEKGVPSQPYHHETLALSDAEAEQLLRKVKRSIAACTALASTAFRPICRRSIECLPSPFDNRRWHTCQRRSKRFTVPITRCVGQMACSITQRFVRPLVSETGSWCFIVAGRSWRRPQRRLQEQHDVERFISDLRQTLKAPWTAEHRNAFAAAIGSLRQPG